MNVHSNFGKKIANAAALVLAAHLAAQAQNPVESTHVDEKFAYTTVVYKNKAADDQAVLNSLDNSFGIGDVVRVTLAPPPPPKPAPIETAPAPLTAKNRELSNVRTPSIYHSPVSASEPVYADKQKGEDTWLPKTQAVATVSLTSSAKPLDLGTKQAQPVAVLALPAKEAGQAAVAKQAQPGTVANLPAPKEAASAQAERKSPAAAAVPKAEPAVPSGGKSVKAERSAKSNASAKSYRSAKKSVFKFPTGKTKVKGRKHAKQRYSCPKF